MRHSLQAAVLLIAASFWAHGAHAAVADRLQVRIVTGGQDMAAGGVVELRIYEAGKAPRRLPLAHGEVWPRDSTLVLPVTLGEPLEARNVVRFSLYYRAASPLSPPWEVEAADVQLQPGDEHLLNATLSGSIARQGEIASEERESSASTCASDADCDDHRECNGHERCSPHAAGADTRGCIKGAPTACPVNQVCTEAHGCRGLEAAAAKPR